MGTKWTLGLAGLLVLGNLQPGEARATSLEITPIAVHLVPGTNATTIEIMNRGGLSAAIHLRAFAWSQDGDKDVLAPTADIIMSPPIFTVAKGATQTVRLMLRRAATMPGEHSYRLLIDEVPPVNATDQQIVIAMRVSLPVITASAAPKASPLQWRAARGEGGRVILTATNPSQLYERVHAISVTLADGSEHAVAASGANSYILAGSRRQWVVGLGDNPARELRLIATTRSGKSEQVLALAP